MPDFPRVCVLWLSVVFIASVGCNPPAAKPDAAPSGAVADADASSPAAAPEDFTLSVSLNKVTADDEETQFRRTFPKPTAAVIDEQVKSLDWKAAPNRPYVIIGRMQDGKINQMKMQGTVGTPNLDGLLHLICIDPPQALRSGPLESAEAAIPLLASFAADDGKWRSMIAWEQVE